jgi:hypothetical protein
MMHPETGPSARERGGTALLRRTFCAAEVHSVTYIDILFDAPAGDGARFREIQDGRGCRVEVGRWLERPDGSWALRIARDDLPEAHVDDTLTTKLDASDGEPWRDLARPRARPSLATVSLQAAASFLCSKLDDVERRAKELRSLGNTARERGDSE